MNNSTILIEITQFLIGKWEQECWAIRKILDYINTT